MNRQTRMPLCWVLVAWMAVAGTAAAQGPVPRPKFNTWNPPVAHASGYYGILGEIAKPGVYSGEGREITLQELVHQAGGVTPNASPAVRLVRQNRVARGQFFDPTGRDPLVPGDLVLIDAVHPQPNAKSVWIAMIGVMDRPVVLQMMPNDAQVGRIMLALGQSDQLARSVQFVPPSRQRPPSSLSAPLTSGTVLIFDSKLLIAGNLPSFPDAIPFARTAAQPLMTNATPPTSIGIPQPSTMPQLPDQIPDHRLPVTTATRNHGDVEATTLPFSNGGQRPQANTASLPAPGSRLQPEPVLPQLSDTKRKSNVPTINSDSEIVTNIDDDLDLNIDDEPAMESAAPVGFGIWQMLGIGGTVASLVGLAVLSRNLMGKDSPMISSPVRDDDIVPASIKKRSAMPSPHMSRPHRRFDMPEPTNPVAKAPRFSPQAIAESKIEAPVPQQEPHDLAELLAMQGLIETESVVLPHGLKLRRSPLSTAPFFRIDEAAELPGPPHEKPVKAGTPQRSLDDAASMKIPAPHFKTAPQPTMEPAPEMVEPAMLSGKAIERALHQLLRGKPS